MANPYGFDDGAQNTAPSSITSGQTTLPLSSTSAFAKLATGSYQAILMIQDTGTGGVGASKYEFVLATGNNTGTNTITGLTRGQGGTAAQSFVAGATVTQVVEASIFQSFAQTATTVEQVFSGQVTAPALKASGAGSPFTGVARFLGSMTTAGPPTSGTGTTGDYGFDVNDVLWTCTAGGTPGTWQPATSVKFAEYLPSGVSSQTISSIPSGFRRIELDIHARSTNATASVDLQVQANGDVGGDYDWERFYGAGVTGGWASGEGHGVAFMALGFATGASAPQNSAAHANIIIPNYTSTVFDKFFTGKGTLAGAYSAGNLFTVQSSGVWRQGAGSAVALTSLKVLLSAGNFVTGSLITVYLYV